MVSFVTSTTDSASRSASTVGVTHQSPIAHPGHGLTSVLSVAVAQPLPRPRGDWAAHVHLLILLLDL